MAGEIGGAGGQDQGLEAVGLGASAARHVHFPIEDVPDEGLGPVVKMRPDFLEVAVSLPVFCGLAAEQRLDGSD